LVGHKAVLAVFVALLVAVLHPCGCARCVVLRVQMLHQE
jgi:hypothetical protein